MKKLKNVFLLGFLISLSIFLGTNFSFLVECICGDGSFYYIASSVEEGNIKIEKDYFKSNHFDNVVSGILDQLKYSVADEDNYSDDPSYGGYEETQKQYIKYNKKNSKEYLKTLDNIKYFSINNKTKEVFTNTDYKTIGEFKKNANGYYQAQFDNENLVDRKIDGQKYKQPSDFSYMNDDVDNNDDISAYISISKDIVKSGNLAYDYKNYQEVLKQYDICKKVGLPALALAVVFLAVYIIMNFKLPKTKREFWHYYNKIPLEVVIAFLATDISMIFVVADTNNGTMVKQLCVIPIFILLFYFILLIKQISNFERKRDFWGTSWIFKIICWILRKSKEAFRKTRTLIQTSQSFTLIKKIIALAVICVIAELLFGALFFGPLGIIIALGIQLGFLVYLVKRLSYLSE
ncbi:hypothetical protein, partial [Intestinibacter sp.]|uniref:hypothetical protein n=1 Tax=Intestinibacter sp. TaxID=1965304 RepID=UPI003F15D999